MINPTTSSCTAMSPLTLVEHASTPETRSTASTLDNGATVAVDTVEETNDLDAHHHDQRPTSSMTHQLSQSLQAWSKVGRLLDSLGQRTIYLGAEEVRSRIATRPRRDVDAASSSEHESPPKKRRTATLSDESHDDNDDDTDASPEVTNDALQIKRMAVLYAQMRETHAKFERELQDFVVKTEERTEQDLLKKFAEVSAPPAKVE